MGVARLGSWSWLLLSLVHDVGRPCRPVAGHLRPLMRCHRVDHEHVYQFNEYKHMCMMVLLLESIELFSHHSVARR